MDRNFIKRLMSSMIILPLSILFIVKGSLFFLSFLGILFFVTSYEWIKMSKKKELMKIFGILFLILSFYSAFQLRENLELNLFLFIILISISTDIGGYIFGKFLKGPKLTKISPKKTYSGVIGSLLLPVFSGLIYIQYLPLKFETIKNEFNLTFLILILSISAISQLGDLTISYFKRLSKIKDTGKILPGHGGLLDRIDGLIFVIPIVYLFQII